MLLALAISHVGTALQATAQAWLRWELTRSPADRGLLGLVQVSPLLGLPMLGGMLADRWPQRTVLLVAQAVRAAVALGTSLAQTRSS